jgi:hypothetical protein
MEQRKHTGKAKLSIDQVILALTELKHLSGRELARKWNVSHATVNNVRKGKSWKSHVQLLGLTTPQRNKPVKEDTSLQPAQ